MMDGNAFLGTDGRKVRRTQKIFDIKERGIRPLKPDVSYLWSMAYSLGGCSCRGAPLRDFTGVSSSG